MHTRRSTMLMHLLATATISEIRMYSTLPCKALPITLQRPRTRPVNALAARRADTSDGRSVRVVGVTHWAEGWEQGQLLWMAAVSQRGQQAVANIVLVLTD